jgi:hypothetical protein
VKEREGAGEVTSLQTPLLKSRRPRRLVAILVLS